MEISFDPDKSVGNAVERGLPFEMVAEFDFETALFWQDERFEYAEERWIAIGSIANRLHVVCFTLAPDGIRVISFRKANDRECARYEKA